MAEAIGLVASLVSIAEVGTQVASTLWKLGINLKNAGREAKEISKKIRLVSKAIRQIEPKLQEVKSLADLSLVQDYIVLCSERLEEAQRLITVLEHEMSSQNMCRRTILKIRFLLEKSKFSLLLKDMDSLQMTLNLYLSMLAYQQAGSNEKILREVRDQLVEMKSEVEADLEDRSASASITAALLSIQYDIDATLDPQFLRPLSGTPISDVSSQDDEEVFEQDINEKSHDVSQEMQSLSLYNRSKVDQKATNISMVPLDMVHDASVSNALVTFTQIQMVQKKTLNRAEFQLNSQKVSEGSTKVPDQAVRPTETSAKPPPPIPQPEPPRDQFREKLTREHSQEFLQLNNEKLGLKTSIAISSLVESDLPDVIENIYYSILQYDPPVKKGDKSDWNYHPIRQLVTEYRDTKIEEEFIDYFIQYAEWWTDDRKFKALKARKYVLQLEDGREIPLHQWAQYLLPGEVVSIRYLSRELSKPNLITLRHEKTGQEWEISGEGPYAKDLRVACKEGGQVRIV